MDFSSHRPRWRRFRDADQNASSDARLPRLTQRFAVYAGVALLAAGGGIFLVVHSAAIVRAEQQALQRTRVLAKSILRDQLRASDFGYSRVSAHRARQLDRLFRDEILVDGALRVRLYTPDGIMVYSTDRSLVEPRSTAPDLIARAVADHPTSVVSQLDDDGGHPRGRKVLEAYVPIKMRGHGTVGVLEVYEDYAPISAAARADFMSLAGIVTVVLFLLYLSFLPLLRRVSRRLRRQLAHIEYQSFHDALTGLPNRELFHDRVAQALLDARRRGEQLAVMLVDLDRFKEVNDTLGHGSGDTLLRQVADVMRSALRASDTVARLGGDEFGVLAPAIASNEAALQLAATLKAAILAPHEVSGVELEVDASIGIALFPEHGYDVELLVQRADVAMYLSKATHAPAIYAAEHDHYSPRRLALMGQLRRAISERELVVHYQPQAALPDGQIRSVEALVRWQHPTEGLLPPDAFVPLAEQVGVIRQLTLFVLDEALQQCRRWRDQGHELRVAVNITGRDLLDMRLPREVEELLQRWDLKPDCLELELTENTVLSDPQRARAILLRLAELGVHLAVDDFGAGNSSLGYLKRLPIGVLKIDKSFVLNMQSDPDDAVIVRSTIELGHNLGLRVVAEGVEDEVAWSRLSALGCDVAQGYYLARPGPAESMTALLEQRRSDAGQAARQPAPA